MPTVSPRRAFVYWVALGALLIALIVGLRVEANARTDDVCRGSQQSQDVLRKIIKVATEPAPLTGLTPERAAVVSQLNTERLHAREKYLLLVPTIRC